MAKTVNKVIGIMDPNYYSFLATLEDFFAFLKPEIKLNDAETYNITTRRIKCRPYNVLGASSSCSVMLNRGAHWNPHHNSFFTIISPKVHMINDMFSFKAIDKNAGYGQMHELGLKIPKTWAIPQKDYSELYEGASKNPQFNPDLIFHDHELFNLAAIGEEVGYPAYLKPQAGGGWIGVERVTNYQELQAAYDKSGSRQLNLQKEVDFKKFVRSIGIGPQIMPLHYNPKSEFSHDRYLYSEDKAVEHNFLTAEEKKEITQICKTINSFYGWDHNTNESLINEEGDIYNIDFVNAYPDSSLTSLHYFFPDVVKAMVKWLLFCSIYPRHKSTDFTYHWQKYFKIAENTKLSYREKLAKYEELADKHFETEKFEEFCKTHLQWLDEKAVEYFDSPEFESVIKEEVLRYFKIPHEIPKKIAHYRGLIKFWVHCERNRLAQEKEKTPEKVEEKEKVTA